MLPDAEVSLVDTPVGTARIHRYRPTGRGSVGLAVMGHGAGGSINAPDIVAVSRHLLESRWQVVLVEQPYRVLGRRAPAPAAQLDAAWVAATRTLKTRGKPLIAGGRSSGARVACRTAVGVEADGVLALAFPLHPPGKPDKTRVDELLGAGVPVLVVQGERDPFGTPAEFPDGTDLVAVTGDHSLRAGARQAADAVMEWIGRTPALTTS